MIKLYVIMLQVWMLGFGRVLLIVTALFVIFVWSTKFKMQDLFTLRE